MQIMTLWFRFADGLVAVERPLAFKVATWTKDSTGETGHILLVLTTDIYDIEDPKEWDTVAIFGGDKSEDNIATAQDAIAKVLGNPGKRAVVDLRTLDVLNIGDAGRAYLNRYCAMDQDDGDDPEDVEDVDVGNN